MFHVRDDYDHRKYSFVVWFSSGLICVKTENNIIENKPLRDFLIF